MTVRLLMGIGAGVYFDFATSSFHVPSVLSAPKAATVVIARAISALVRIVRICQAPLNFGGRGCLRSNGAHTPTPIWHRWRETRNTLIAPNSIPVDQLQGAMISRAASGGKGADWRIVAAFEEDILSSGSTESNRSPRWWKRIHANGLPHLRYSQRIPIVAAFDFVSENWRPKCCDMRRIPRTPETLSVQH